MVRARGISSSEQKKGRCALGRASLSQISEQMTVIQSTTTNCLAFTAEIRSFLTKKAELEAEYSRALDKLAVSFYNKRKDHPGAQKTSKNDEMRLERAWCSLLQEVRHEASHHASCAESITTQVVDQIRNLEAKKTAMTKKTHELSLVFQTSLSRQYAEVENYHKAYSVLEIETQHQRSKFEERERKAAQTKQAGFSFFKGVDMKDKANKSQDKWMISSKRSEAARHEYLLAMSATNARHSHFFGRLAHVLLDRADFDFFESLSQILIAYATTTIQCAGGIRDAMSTAELIVSRINLATEREAFLMEHQSVFKPPPLFEFEPLQDEPSSIVNNAHSNQALTDRMKVLESELQSAFQETETKRGGLIEPSSYIPSTNYLGPMLVEDDFDAGVDELHVLYSRKGAICAQIETLENAQVHRNVDFKQFEDRDVGPENLPPMSGPFADPNSRTSIYTSRPISSVDMASRRISETFNKDNGDYSVIGDFTNTEFVPNANGVIPITIPDVLSEQMEPSAPLMEESIVMHENDSTNTGTSCVDESNTSLAPERKDSPLYGGILPCEAVALFDYSPQAGDQIGLVQGRSTVVTNVYVDGWCRGQNMEGGQLGLFPASYVELHQDKKLSVNGNGVTANFDAALSSKQNDIEVTLDGSMNKDLSERIVPDVAAIVENNDSVNEVMLTGYSPYLSSISKEINLDDEEEDEENSDNIILPPLPDIPAHRRAVALSKYVANTSGELNLEIGDVVEIVLDEDEEWWEGCIIGSDFVGTFPADIVSVLSEETTLETSKLLSPTNENAAAGDLERKSEVELLPQKNSATLQTSYSCVRALYDYQSRDDLELNLTPGDLIEILHRDYEDRGWWYGRMVSSGREGSFPVSYVEAVMVDHMGRDISLPSISTTATSEPLHWSEMVDLASRGITDDTCEVRALYEWQASRDEELSLAAHDVITIINRETGHTGWWLGRLENGKEGLFAITYVDANIQQDIAPAHLWRCKGKQNVQVVDMPICSSSLNSGDVFVLDTGSLGKNVYVWSGMNSNPMERIQSLEVVVKRIREERPSKYIPAIVIGEGEEDDEFWSYFEGGKGPIMPSVPDSTESDS